MLHTSSYFEDWNDFQISKIYFESKDVLQMCVTGDGR